MVMDRVLVRWCRHRWCFGRWIAWGLVGGGEGLGVCMGVRWFWVLSLFLSFFVSNYYATGFENGKMGKWENGAWFVESGKGALSFCFGTSVYIRVKDLCLPLTLACTRR